MLLESELEAVKTNSGLPLKTFSLFYDSGREGAMSDALHALCEDIETSVREGCDIVVLSDRCEGEPQLERPPIPTLLAVGAVHHHLIRQAPPSLLQGCHAHSLERMGRAGVAACSQSRL